MTTRVLSKPIHSPKAASSSAIPIARPIAMTPTRPARDTGARLLAARATRGVGRSLVVMPGSGRTVRMGRSGGKFSAARAAVGSVTGPSSAAGQMCCRRHRSVRSRSVGARRDYHGPVHRRRTHPCRSPAARPNQPGRARDAPPERRTANACRPIPVRRSPVGSAPLSAVPDPRRQTQPGGADAADRARAGGRLRAAVRRLRCPGLRPGQADRPRPQPGRGGRPGGVPGDLAPGKPFRPGARDRRRPGS